MLVHYDFWVITFRFIHLGLLGLVLFGCNRTLPPQSSSSPLVTPELSSGESQTLRNTATLPPQVATPQITSKLPPPLEIQSSRDNPILDMGEILSVLETLQRREEAWFSRPGWYR